MTTFEPAGDQRAGVSEATVEPLSPAQARLWLLGQLGSDGRTRHSQGVLFLRGELDVADLRRRLAEIAARHEALRTTITVVDGAPRQSIAAAASVQLQCTDLRRHNDAVLAALDHGRALGRVELSITEAPPWRADLLRVADDLHVLFAIAHPIIADARSVRLILDELGRHDGARPEPPCPAPIQFADFARRQRERLHGATLERLLGHWRRELSGAPARLLLPGANPGGRRPDSEQVAFALPDGAAAAVRELAARIGVSLDALLLAAVVVLLHRYGGTADLVDLVVGVHDDARRAPEDASVVGPLDNLLALRVRVDPREGFAHLTRRVQQLFDKARAHGELPLARLIDELRPPRSVSHAPLVQVAFAIDGAAGSMLGAVAGVGESTQMVGSASLDLDLDFTVLVAGEPWICCCEYRTDVYEDTFIAQLMRSWRMLLAGLVEAADAEVRAIPMLAPSDRAVLERWNTTAVDFGSASVVELFEEQVRRDPQRPALLGAEGALRYGELDARANHLARRLIAAGVGPEVLVAVMLERSFDQVVALLAVLKAGGAYLPIDPEDPRERRTFLLADAGITTVICRGARRPELASAASVIAVDEPLAVDGAESRPLPPPPAPRQLAYVTYTSGSTGQPKGVMIEHAALANQLQWLQASFPLSPSDRVPCKYGFTFDAALWEIFGTLSCGAQLLLVEAERERDLDHLLELFTRYQVTVIDVVPSFLEALLRHPGFARLRSLRRVTCGGEALTAVTARRFAARSEAELHNLYGPTEATITASAHRVAGELLGDLVPIGRPAANTTIQLLDEVLQPVPPGVPGEICIGGAQLARGYLGRPELTAERFVDDPNHPGVRLFRSGDLGRLRSDGELEFIGRRDFQVKVRGHRVELEEIEAAIAAHLVVRQCAVTLDASVAAVPSLSAYVVAAPGCEPRADELRAALQARLPDYMIPARFFVVPKLPETPQGKLDRARVASLAGRRLVDQAAIEPRSYTERRLAALWQELLGCDEVSARANFFEAGGDSLMAVGLVLRVGEELGITVEVRDVFEAPTIEQLATRIEESAVRRHALLPPMAAGPSTGTGIFAVRSPAQRLRLRRGPPGRSRPEDHVHLAVWFVGPLEERSMQWALKQVVARHPMLRVRHVEVVGGAEEDDGLAQIVEPDVEAVLSVAQLASTEPAARTRELTALVDAEARRPFDLRHAPLLRMLVIHATPDTHALVIVAHRAVADQPSLWVVLRDLSRFYFHQIDGCELPAPLSHTYADFVRWQREIRDSGLLAAQVEYWERQLAGPSQPSLPGRLSRRPPLAATAEGAGAAVIPISLSDEVSTALLALARASGVGTFVTLLAALQLLLGRSGAVEDVMVATPFTGRRGLPAIEPLVGVFEGLMPLRARLSGDESFDVFVQRTRDVIHAARANQEILLLEPALTARVAVHCMVFTHQVEHPPTPGSVALRPVEVEVGAAEHDLSLHTVERAGSLRGSLRYHAEAFDAALLERFARDYERLLAVVARHAERSISALWRDEGQDGHIA